MSERLPNIRGNRHFWVIEIRPLLLFCHVACLVECRNFLPNFSILSTNARASIGRCIKSGPTDTMVAYGADIGRNVDTHIKTLYTVSCVRLAYYRLLAAHNFTLKLRADFDESCCLNDDVFCFSVQHCLRDDGPSRHYRRARVSLCLLLQRRSVLHPCRWWCLPPSTSTAILGIAERTGRERILQARLRRAP